MRWSSTRSPTSTSIGAPRPAGNARRPSCAPTRTSKRAPIAHSSSASTRRPTSGNWSARSTAPSISSPEPPGSMCWGGRRWVSSGFRSPVDWHEPPSGRSRMRWRRSTMPARGDSSRAAWPIRTATRCSSRRCPDQEPRSANAMTRSTRTDTVIGPMPPGTRAMAPRCPMPSAVSTSPRPPGLK